LHPATVLRALTEDPWNVAYVQPSMRPKDGRYGENPNRLQHYYQYQVILKPSPDNIQDLYLESLEAIGISIKQHDIRFVEDDWENPTVGAWGLGWEVWCDGMEVSQFTYMQQVGGVDASPVPGELTYGLERLAMYIQEQSSVYDIVWNKQGVTYGDIYKNQEREFSAYNLEFSQAETIQQQFIDAEEQCQILIEQSLPLPAYDHCLKASHLLNLLDARGVLGVTERASYIGRVRNLAKACCELWVKNRGAQA
jgi:glycyl-tRNA synthetase alpha chain